MESKGYVWYASYGSNINRDRFLCYILGGKPPGSAKTELGCRDHTLPLDDRMIDIDYPLYFSGHSDRWGGGVAFIGHQPQQNTRTVCRMYLITEEQFFDVLKQENNGVHVDIDLQEVMHAGAKTADAASTYGRIVYVGREGEVPVFSFTSPYGISHNRVTTPSREYLATILAGVKHGSDAMGHEQIIAHFSKIPGIRHYWSLDLLTALVRSI